MLYFKGFHALQTHRLAHWLYKKGRKDFAYYLQSRASAVFQTDINPAAAIGRGIFLDHATGFVCGETAVIEDDVSILHGVTLGGTGKENEDRHPKIRRGVLIGAGAKILGNIEIGHCARIAAGSVVVKAVPHNVTVAGRSRQDRRRGRLRRAVAHHGPDDQRDRTLISGAFSDTLSRNRAVDFCKLGWRFASSRPRTSRNLEIYWRLPWTFRKSGSSTPISSACSAIQKIRVVPRPKKDDSAEVYIGEEFIGVLFVDDEDDDRSFQFQMAILEEDLVDQG